MKSKQEKEALFKQTQAQIQAAKARYKDPELVVQLFGYIDENGKPVCKALDLLNQLMLEEIKKP